MPSKTLTNLQKVIVAELKKDSNAPYRVIAQRVLRKLKRSVTENYVGEIARRFGLERTLAVPSAASADLVANQDLGSNLIRSLIGGGETCEIEFNRNFDEETVLHSVVSFANSNGGHLLIGVNDNGEIVGIDPKNNGTIAPHLVESLIVNRTEPPLRTSAQVVVVDGVDVLVIKVPKADHVVSTSDGLYLRRTVDIHEKVQHLPMRPHEVIQAAGSISESDFSKAPLSELFFDDLSQVELRRFRELSKGSGDRELANLPDEDLLKALNLVDLSGSLTVGALLLFGKESDIRRWLPHYKISSFSQSWNEKEELPNISGPLPLFKASEVLIKAIMARSGREECYSHPLKRLDLPDFSRFAVRELLSNAIVYRDYRSPEPTIVKIEEFGRFTISNPGGFPAGVRLDNLLTLTPRPRNTALAAAFKSAGIVKGGSNLGIGIRRAFAEQLSLGRSAPDYSRSSLDSVVVSVRAGRADQKLAFFISEERQNSKDFSLEDLLAFREIRSEKRITTARAAELFQVGHNEARQKLDDLAIRGYVAPRGYGKGLSYRPSAELYKKLGESADFIWVSGFDALQQEQLVMSYVEVNGSIARQDAAEVCRIDAATAGRLLRRLRDEGKLVLVGAKRGARYVLPSRSTSRSGY